MKVKVWLKTNLVNSERYKIIEIDDEEWNDMFDAEREDVCREVMFEMIDWGFEELKND